MDGQATTHGRSSGQNLTWDADKKRRRATTGINYHTFETYFYRYSSKVLRICRRLLLVQKKGRINEIRRILCVEFLAKKRSTWADEKSRQEFLFL